GDYSWWRLGRLLLGPILGMGPERNLVPHCASDLYGNPSRKIHELDYSKAFCSNGGRGLYESDDGLVWSELHPRQWSSFLWFFRGGSNLPWLIFLNSDGSDYPLYHQS